MHREAEAIEQQAKGMKVGGPASNATPQQVGKMKWKELYGYGYYFQKAYS